MKRQSLLFIAGGLMALASCTSETTTTTNNEMSQASIDSAVNVRVEEMRMQMMMENDAKINEMALYKADSMCAAMKGQAPKPRPTVTRKPTNGGALTPGGSKPTDMPSGGGLGSKSDQNNTGGGLGSKSDQNQANEKKGGLGSRSDQGK